MPIKAILAFSYGITLTKLFLKIFLDETPYFFISNSEISTLDVSESVLKKCADFFKDFFLRMVVYRNQTIAISI